MIIKPVKPLYVIYRYRTDLTYRYEDEYKRILKGVLDRYNRNRNPDGTIDPHCMGAYSDIYEKIIEYDSTENTLKATNNIELYCSSWKYYHIVLSDGYVSKNLGKITDTPKDVINTIVAIKELSDHLQGKNDNEDIVDLDNIIF